jgi:hypothetical protein
MREVLKNHQEPVKTVFLTPPSLTISLMWFRVGNVVADRVGEHWVTAITTLQQEIIIR